jgi:cytochrome c peroxidase
LWNGKIQGSLEDIMLFEVQEFFKADMQRFSEDEDYSRLFFEAFGEETITYQLAANALAQFERTMISQNSVYDKVFLGERFFTDEEYNGYELFNTEEGDCFHCHGGILLTDNLFHNNGLDSEINDPGLAEITGDPLDQGKFKTPTLRNIEFTAPYMHDGRYATLEEVIDFYSEGLNYSPTVDPLMKNVHQGGIRLTEKEKQDLIAFLKTFSDTSYLVKPELSDPFN